VYLLDQLMRQVPVGSVGEICIGGATLADGYLHMPEETARRFVADPFDPGGRVYRTGDRGRFLEDGRLEFLGRDDDQLKIRGFRVEAGEIERALMKHPAIRDAVVSLVPLHHGRSPASLVEKLSRLDSSLAEKLLSRVEAMS
jgi:acyl-CoA synthetase (AMP-forming)/AMP-acid ligase II